MPKLLTTEQMAEFASSGCLFFDELLTLLFQINNNPKHAFNLVAIKDLRGIPAKYKKEDQP